MVEEVEQNGLTGVELLPAQPSELTNTTGAGASSRLELVVALLCDAHGSSAGQLHLSGEAGLQLVAARDAPASEQVARAAQVHLARHLVEDEGDTALVYAPSASVETQVAPHGADKGYRFHVLTTSKDACVGVVALKDDGQTRTRVAPRRFIEAVAEFLVRGV